MWVQIFNEKYFCNPVFHFTEGGELVFGDDMICVTAPSQAALASIGRLLAIRWASVVARIGIVRVRDVKCLKVERLNFPKTHFGECDTYAPSMGMPMDWKRRVPRSVIAGIAETGIHNREWRVALSKAKAKKLLAAYTGFYIPTFDLSG